MGDTNLELNERKMANAILYFIEHTGPSLGKIKLWKLLYFADFRHYAEHGRPITGEMYVRYPHGPLPSRGELVLKKMKQEQQVRINMSPVGTYQRYDFEPLSACDTELFDSTELQTLAAVAAQWRDEPGCRLERASHQEAPWLAAKEFAYLDYRLAVCSEPLPVEPEDEQLESSPALDEILRDLS